MIILKGVEDVAHDNFFKRMMQDFLKQYDVQPEVSVGKLPLRIDMIIKRSRERITEMKIPVMERHLNQINIMEYKSSHDIPRHHDLAKLIGYLGLYCDQNELGIDSIMNELSLWYVSARRPPFLDSLFRDDFIEILPSKGLYRLKVPLSCPFFLLIISELEVSEENIPLLFLSSGKALRETIRFIFREKMNEITGLEKYLSLIYLLNYKDVHDMTEIQSSLPKTVKENIKMAIKDIGLKEVIHLIGLGEVIKEVGLGEVIKEIGLGEVIKEVGLGEVIKEVGLENLIEFAGVEEVEKLLKKMKKNDK
ncbi:MAG: hypothetical protein ACXQS8_05970 [Candidatus Helarchaeales archaeon]